MATIRPNAEPAATSVAAGDIFLIDGTTGVRALAATQVGVLDANLNLPVNNVIEGFVSTATAAGTTVLTAASAAQQFFTGTTTQTVTLPVVSTYAKAGAGFFFQNSSTGALTVQSSGGNTVKIIGPGAFAIVTCVAITGTTAASWQATYFADIVVSGKVLTLNNSLTLAGTDGTTMTFPSTSATVARTDAANTFTGTQTVGALVVTTINGNTITAGTGILTIAAGKTLTANNSLTFAGTDATTQTFPTTSATIARTDAGQTFTGTQAFGTLTATTINGNTFTAGTGTLTIAAGKTHTVNNSITLAGTDATTMTFPATSATIARTDAANTFTGTQTIGALTATTINGNTVTAGTGVLTLAAGKTLTASNTLTFAGTDASTLNVGVGGTLTGSSSAAVFYDNIPQNSKSAAYTTVLADAEKHILHPAADTTARTFTIDSNANVAYPIGTTITFINQNAAGVLTIAITADTMRLTGAGTTGSRTLAANGIATAVKLTSTEWIISGVGLT